jgi:hypothetical protein
MSSGLNLKRPDFLARLLVCPDHLGGCEVTQRLAQPVQGKLDPSGDMNLLSSCHRVALITI